MSVRLTVDRSPAALHCYFLSIQQHTVCKPPISAARSNRAAVHRSSGSPNSAPICSQKRGLLPYISRRENCVETPDGGLVDNLLPARASRLLPRAARDCGSRTLLAQPQPLLLHHILFCFSRTLVERSRRCLRLRGDGGVACLGWYLCSAGWIVTQSQPSSTVIGSNGSPNRLRLIARPVEGRRARLEELLRC